MAKRRFSYEEKHRTVNSVKQKLCTKCKTWKDEGEFYKDATHKDGVKSWCKKCESEYYRERYGKYRKSVKDRLSYEQRHRIVAGVKQKRCCRCEKWNDESRYCRSRRSKDGLQWRCKECESEYTRKYYRQKTKNQAASKSHKRRLAV